MRLLAPASEAEALAILTGEMGNAQVLAGGTDLLPNMKRRLQAPRTLVSIRRLGGLRQASNDGRWLVLGGARRLADLCQDPVLRAHHHALLRAAAQVGSPVIRQSATLAGNLCLDTRCQYYNQSEHWRKSIDYCMKAPRATDGIFHAARYLRQDTPARPADDGETDVRGEVPGSLCWVAPGSPRCWAVASSDTAPALIALGAEVELASTRGTRRVPVLELYRDDGMAYLAKDLDELLVAIHVPIVAGMRSTYWKMRRRGSIDFPVAGCAAALEVGSDGVVESARVVLGGLASHPLERVAAAAGLIGHRLTDDRIAACAEEAVKAAKPLDNTDFKHGWRKKVARALIEGVLRELRGDQPAQLGLLARHARRELALPVLGNHG